MATTETRVDIDALCTVAEQTCRIIAPQDLGDVPVYVVPQTRLPADFAGPSQCEGYTTGSMDLYYRDAIGSLWRGRGACMVIDDTDLDRMDALDMELHFQSVAIHELAHIIERPALFHDRPMPAPDAIRREATNIAKAVAAEEPDIEKFIPFLGHGPRYIRCALHLCHRARAAGIPVAPCRVFMGRRYGLSHISLYQKALGSEPRQSADVRIHDLLDTGLPKAFMRLWTSDVVHWFSFCHPYGERFFS